MKKIITVVFITIAIGCSSPIKTPLEKSNFSKLTSYNELIDFVKLAKTKSKLIDLEYFAVSSEGRKIPALKISNDNFADTNKIRVIIFAQQHGDEQSGKEGALLLLNEIANGNLDYLFNKLDLILVPQVNPDGSEKNRRRNANGADLNRNHLILSETETTGLHSLFYKCLPDATLDVHEYSPYSEDWIEFGYLKNYDEQIGTLTNPNVSKNIIKLQKEQYLDFIKKYLDKKGVSSNEYLLGGPPGKYRMRYSTIDVNDGRQGFGILNSFSFIQEGKNGRDSIDNIEHRALGQCEGIKGYLQFLCDNSTEIKRLVKSERARQINPSGNEEVIIRMEHVKGDSPVSVKLKSISTGKDSLFIVDDFNSKIETYLQVKKPNGYLIPKTDSKLKILLGKHHMEYSDFILGENEKVVQYNILEMNKSIDEEDEHFDPVVKEEEVVNPIIQDYYFVPTNQLASNLIVIAFEPQSMLGVAQYSDYNYLFHNKVFPILKVVKIK